MRDAPEEEASEGDVDHGLGAVDALLIERDEFVLNRFGILESARL
jgi:hypothetical protein